MRTIALVDDENRMLELIELYLQDSYTCIKLNSGREILNLIDVDEPDLIILVYKEIDQARFDQVLLNLLDNALKYTHVNKRVFLKLDENFIEVMDEGGGVDEQSLPYLFDRFYRVDSSRNRETGGTGLGLAITKEIVEAHKGTIVAVNVENGLKVVIDLRGIPG